MPSFSMRTHGMHMMQCVEEMDLNLEMSNSVWNTPEENHREEEEEHEEDSP